MKKNSILTLSITGVLTAFTVASFTLYNVGLCSHYRLGLYSETTMAKFLKEKESLQCSYSTLEEKAYGEDTKQTIRNYLSTVSFEEEGNSFPFQYQKNTCYVDLVITVSSFYFRMDGTYTRIALENRDYRNNDSSYFCAVRYYSCTSEAGQGLVNLIKETFAHE